MELASLWDQWPIKYLRESFLIRSKAHLQEHGNYVDMLLNFIVTLSQHPFFQRILRNIV